MAAKMNDPTWITSERVSSQSAEPILFQFRVIFENGIH